ncbi:hypothetical protein BKA58DRAFT_138701 [Alternaria rosae]|uniref:uncharacterized protein n=1 Tax=Alternaria rosae TaxID=1187941 RepID=UPI001E8EEFF2|nr:uncharacterized protein BKA58DRAFT_138701 [Alternaria rosae]KAH6876297.1 hypothetical protein BKA58DRAFT_138701 [Alternaria rosae]
MPKRAHSRSSTASTEDSDYNAESNVFGPTKRRAHSAPPRSLSPLPVNGNLDTRGCKLPLTRENLTEHTLSTSLQHSHPPEPVLDTGSSIPPSGPPPSMSARSGSPTRSALDTRVTLQSYRVEVDTHRELPAELRSHLDTVLLCKRDGPRSPNARRVVQHRLAASLENESTGIRRLEPLLLFAGEDDPSAIHPVPMISSKLDFNLSPPGKTLPRLSQRQADTIIGYLSNSQAYESTLQTAFTPDEEAALADFTLNPVLVFPFLSSQWKPATGESHIVAHYQSARDGAAIVRYLDEFYSIAYGRPATALECAHVSFTCDYQALNIWLHWRELDAAGDATYYMKSIFDCTLRNEKHLLEARELLWNHIDYALGSRLHSLKDALPSFCTEFPKRQSKTTKSIGSSRASVQSDSRVLASISLPPTPLSNHNEHDPVKRYNKRLRTGENDHG